MSLDLSDYEELARRQEDGISVTLLDPVTGEKTEGVVVVAGPDSRRARRARKETITHLAGLRADNKPEDYDASTHMLARCIVSWSGIVRGGEPLELTVESAIEVLDNFPWIEAQLNNWAADRRNFTRGSQSESQTS